MNKKTIAVLVTALMLSGCTDAGISVTSSVSGIPASSVNEPDVMEIVDAGLPEELTGSWRLESVNTSDGFILKDFTGEMGELKIYPEGTASFLYRSMQRDINIREDDLTVTIEDGGLYENAPNQEWHAVLTSEQTGMVFHASAENGELYFRMPAHTEDGVETDYYYVRSGSLYEPAFVEAGNKLPQEVRQAGLNADGRDALLLWVNPPAEVRNELGAPILMEGELRDTVLLLALKDNVYFDLYEGMPESNETGWKISGKKGSYNLSAAEYLWISITVPEGMPSTCIHLETLEGTAWYPFSYNGMDSSFELIRDHE